MMQIIAKIILAIMDRPNVWRDVQFEFQNDAYIGTPVLSVALA